MNILILFGVNWQMKKLKINEKNYTDEHKNYIKKLKLKSLQVRLTQMGILFFSIILWETAAQLKWIDAFIFSSPSRVFRTAVALINSNNLWNNVFYTLCETMSGFVLGTVLGIAFAILIWCSNFIFKVSEPYLVVFNALPKVALGPIIIVWMGSGITSIIIMALLVSVVVSTINILSGFQNVEKDKIFLLKSFGANKFQILWNLILPANISTIMSTLKINVGMSLIGVITGEFLVSSKGIGYLIVYGGQVFKLDLVMAGIFVLLIIAAAIYLVVAKLENIYLKNKK